MAIWARDLPVIPATSEAETWRLFGLGADWATQWDVVLKVYSEISMWLYKIWSSILTTLMSPPVMTSDLFQSWSLSPDRSTVLFHDQVGVWEKLSATFCADCFSLCGLFMNPTYPSALSRPIQGIGKLPASSQSYKSVRKLRDRWRCALQVLAASLNQALSQRGWEEHLLGWQGEVAMVATVITLMQALALFF